MILDQIDKFQEKYLLKNKAYNVVATKDIEQ